MKTIDRPTGTRSNERRRASRVGVEYWVQEDCEAGFYYHRVTNLSPEGFFIEKKIPFQAGQVLTFHWELPGGGHHLKARSRVVDTYRDAQSNILGAGFQFLELDPVARRNIKSLMQKTHADHRGAAFRRNEDDADQRSPESR